MQIIVRFYRKRYILSILFSPILPNNLSVLVCLCVVVRFQFYKQLCGDITLEFNVLFLT